jgi:L-ascorbate metabolism protein UlaG (beta-lactamase superfamily)
MMALFRTLLALMLVLAPGMARACGAIAMNPLLHRASLSDGDGLAVTFLGHASFLIETPGHVTVVTDYNGVNIPRDPPDIATMNHAHSTHYTDHPDPRIRHVLHGWRDDGQPARIDLTEGDLRVRNLPTNIREYGGAGTEYYGNSIFVFESAGLCVAHLSHLHHLLTPDDLAALGEIDVLMAPVDGMWTMNLKDMATVIAQLHPRLVLPMHYYGRDMLQRFLDVLDNRYPVTFSNSRTVLLRQATLPQATQILVLQGDLY